MTTEHNKAREALTWLEGFVELMGCNTEPATTHIATLRSALASLPQEPASQEAEDERAAVEFYRLNPSAAVMDLRRRFGSRHATPEPARAEAVDGTAGIEDLKEMKRAGVHPTCARCGELIFGSVSIAKGSYWHPEHLKPLASAPAEPARVQGEPVAWRFTGLGGMKPFLTQAQYGAQTIGVKKWYEPFRCATCATQPPAAQGAAPLAEKQLHDLWLCHSLVDRPERGSARSTAVALDFARAAIAEFCRINGITQQDTPC